MTAGNPSTAVLIPWGGQCPHRARALAWTTAQYERRHPDWPVIIGQYHDQPWVKARALAAALEHTDAEVLVTADCDLWSDFTGLAVEQVWRGKAWATPYDWISRLDEAATDELVDTGVAGPGRDQVDCRGQIGGGIVVLRRADYERCPMDPRFEGWGHEDSAWALALAALVGQPVRIPGRAIHLWHPHAERLTRSKGSEANEQLWMRYQEWCSRPALMRKLVAEHRCV